MGRGRLHQALQRTGPLRVGSYVAQPICRQRYNSGATGATGGASLAGSGVAQGSFLSAASGVVGQADQVGQTKIGLVVSDGEECVDANLCIAASGQCCVVGGDGRGGFRCPDSC